MALYVALALLGLLLVLAAAMAWQERRRLPERVAIYGVEDSIEYVREGMSPGAREALSRHDVRRILEWAVHYLQDPAIRSDLSEPAVIGGMEMAEYIQERAMADGHAYDGPLIIEVLDLQAQYLAAIGAVGDAVDADEPDSTA